MYSQKTIKTHLNLHWVGLKFFSIIKAILTWTVENKISQNGILFIATNTPNKIFERVIFLDFYKQTHSRLFQRQCRFMRGRSVYTNLIDFTHYILQRSEMGYHVRRIQSKFIFLRLSFSHKRARREREEPSLFSTCKNCIVIYDNDEYIAWW